MKDYLQCLVLRSTAQWLEGRIPISQKVGLKFLNQECNLFKRRLLSFLRIGFGIITALINSNEE